MEYIDFYMYKSAHSPVNEIRLSPSWLRGGGGEHPAQTDPEDVTYIDDDDDQDADLTSKRDIFIAEDYIGIGLKWKDNMDKKVVRARDAALRIPPNALRALLPRDNAVAADILRLVHSLPVETTPSNAAYCSDVPTRLLDVSVISDSIQVLSMFLWPSTRYASTLHANFNDAWLSGSRSIILPSDPKHCYPLWTSALLSELLVTRTKVDAWEKARLSLPVAAETNADCPALATDCEEAFESIPWDYRLLGLGQAVTLRSYQLALFLTDDWLTDDLLCPTFLRIPRTHILFSLGTFSKAITVQDLKLDDGIVQLVQLPALALQLYRSLCSHQKVVAAAVQTLCKLLKSRNTVLVGQGINTDGTNDDGADDTGDRADEDADESEAYTDVFGGGDYPGWYE